MNLEELKEHIKFEEGVKLNDNGEHILYNDSLGYKTLGIGHLVKATDPENEMEVGTVVSQERVDECFEADLYVAINDMEKFTEDMNVDENVKLTYKKSRMNQNIEYVNKMFLKYLTFERKMTLELLKF